MQDFGQFLLFVSFLLTLATALTAVAGALTRNAALMRGARSGFYAATLINVAMAVVLTHGFLSHDFDNKYIATYSDRSMPTVYLLAAFWGGEKGALLFWVTSLSVFGSIALYTKRDRAPIYLAWVTGILATAVLFFDILMVFESSPFETFMTTTGPEDGQGLNPLLQNPVMAFHPPSLLTGYIMFTIPFAFGMAALITKKLDEQWITDTRRWTIVSWTFLSIGLLLGARWAYMEIGWGFWWMWDPVENAGLIPWFTATAFLHSVMIQERRGMLKRWNMILLVLTFMLTIFGTFLTRSQLIVSIHAFANSELPGYFLGYLILIGVVSTLLVGARWSLLRSEARVESFLSRESFFILNNVVLVFCAFVVLWGTVMGKITESPAVQEALGLAGPKVWKEGDFNIIFAPTGIVLLLLMGVGPLISWRRASVRNFNRNFRRPLAWTAVLTALLTIIVALYETTGLQASYGLGFGEALERLLRGLSIEDYASFVVYFLCIFVLFSVFREYHIGTRVRQRKFPGGYVGSFIGMMFKNPRRYGGYLIHISMVFMFIAFTGKVFKVEEPERIMALGQQHEIDKYALTFVGQRHFWSEAEGCAISRAQIVVQPTGTTVDDDQVEALAAWIESRGGGVAQIKTEIDSPKMLLRFADDSERKDVLADFYLARNFRRDFTRVAGAQDALTLQYAVRDQKLLRVMPFLAMEVLRDAQDQLRLGDYGLKASIAGGSSTLNLKFDDARARATFLKRVESTTVPDSILVMLDNPELGAVEVVDRATGTMLLPETRFYSKHNSSTTEVAISGEDFLEDVYVSMQPNFGKPYIKLFMVVFPLVNFLWIGGFLLIVGAAVCLIPRWLGRTVIGLVRPVRAGGTAAILMVAALGAVVAAPPAAQAARAPEPSGFAQPVGGDAYADLLGVLTCACPVAPDSGAAVREDTLGDATCSCREADAGRALIGDLLARETAANRASGRAKYRVLNRLAEVDPAWSLRFRYDVAAYERLKDTTLNTCSGERGMTLAQSKLTCSVRSRWMPIFRSLLTAGAPVSAIQAYYVAENNVSMAPSTPWSFTDLTTKPERGVSFGVPASVLAVALAVLGLLFWRSRTRRAAAAPGVTERESVAVDAELSKQERLLLDDELDVYDV